MHLMISLCAIAILLVCKGNAYPIKVPCEIYSNPSENQANYKRNHKGLYPFIGYQTFRNACDIVIDDFTEFFDPESVRCGDSIYLNIWFLDWFVKQVHDHIKHPYVLVTCDVGSFLPDPGAQKLIFDPKCAAWFGRNMIFSFHPKLIQIPMGQDYSLFSGESDYLLKACEMKGKIPKKHLLYMNHYPREWGDRNKIIKLFEYAPYCFSKNHSGKEFIYTPLPEYLEDLLSSEFTLSPTGLETDCVRTWEALALGCIPIVEHSFLDPLFEGLPVVLVHEWEEINEQFLKDKLKELKGLTDSSRSYFDYWNEKLKGIQKSIRERNTRNASLETIQFEKDDLSDLISILQEHSAGNQGKIHLFYRGPVSSVRAIQLAAEMPMISSFVLWDVWLNKEIWNSLENYWPDSRIRIAKKKITLVDNESHFTDFFSYYHGKAATIFLDLTHYRHSLYWDYSNLNRLRHSLRKDILNIASQMDSGALLCGNMCKDKYVKEVLEQISKDKSLDFIFEIKGNFWFLILP